MFYKNRFSIILTVSILGVGIGLNTAIFSIAYAVLFSPLPYQQPDQLVMLWRTQARRLVTPGQFYDWRDRTNVFESIAAYKDASTSKDARFDLTGDDLPVRLAGCRVSTNLFSVLGVNAIHGRVFTDDEAQPGRDRVVLISDSLWRSHFGGALDAVNKKITLNDEPYVVIGVMPSGFSFTYPNKTDLWVPLTYDPVIRSNRSEMAYKVVARLKTDTTIRQAQQALSNLAENLKQQYPKTDYRTDVLVTSLLKDISEPSRHELFFLLGASSFLLLIACSNVASIMLIRATGRIGELAIRASLGATRARLMQQLLTESLLISVLSGALGLALCKVGLGLFIAIVPADMSRANESAINAQVLVFVFIISALVGVLFGLLPAIKLSKPSLGMMLKENRQTATAGLRIRHLQNIFLVFEVAMTVMLLIGAGLMLRSFWRLKNVDLGFDSKNLLVMQITLPAFRYKADSQQREFYRQLLDSAKKSREINQASLANAAPFCGVDYVYTFKIYGQDALNPSENNSARYRMIDYNYFSTMGMKLIRGRNFSDKDIESSYRVAVVSESLARSYFSNKEVIGKRLIIGKEEEVEIIGIVNDIKQAGLDKPAEPAIYVPYSQSPTNSMCLIIRPSINSGGSLSAMRKLVWAVDARQPIESIATMQELQSRSVSNNRFNMGILIAFAVMALTLAYAGVFEVISYTISQRSQEIGLRIALGARPRDIINLLIKRDLSLVLIGLFCGLVGAITLRQSVALMIYDVSTFDGLTFTVAPLVLLIAALVACYSPIRKALKIDPGLALRCQ